MKQSEDMLSQDSPRESTYITPPCAPDAQPVDVGFCDDRKAAEDFLRAQDIAFSSENRWFKIFDRHPGEAGAAGNPDIRAVMRNFRMFRRSDKSLLLACQPYLAEKEEGARAGILDRAYYFADSHGCEMFVRDGAEEDGLGPWYCPDRTVLVWFVRKGAE